MRKKKTDPRQAIAFARFEALLREMQWKDDWAVKRIHRELADEITEKGVKMWFSRREIPTDRIFDVSDIFEIDAGWLAGQKHIVRKRAVVEGGLCYREIELRREQREAGTPAVRKPEKGRATIKQKKSS